MVLFLKETKCYEQRFLELVGKVWRNNECIKIDAVGATGGLGIFGDPAQISLKGFVTSHHSLSIDFLLVGSTIRGNMTNVYGPHTSNLKEGFIESLRETHQQVAGRHQILGGDFNLITSLEENKGGRIRMEGECVLFRDAIEEMGRVDIFTGENIYTWSNRRRGERHISSHLDTF